MSPVTGFELYLTRNTPKFDAYLRDFFEDPGNPDMERYLYALLRDYTDNGGKRHRPLICLLACEACGGDSRLAWRSAAAIEHFHTAALIHDDIEDGSETRRGKPTMHIAEGVGLAINSGDLALSLVCGTVVHDPNLDDACKLRVLAELVDMTDRTIEGQALDIGWARDGRFDLTVKDYLLMAQHKTAFYSGSVPLAVGAIIAGADDHTVEGLRDFGMAAGLAFQIQDDVLNLVGKKESVAKDFRSDITEGKRTLIAIHALRHSPDAVRLEEILGLHTADPGILAEAVDIMAASGSIDYARRYALDIIQESRGQLREAVPKSRARDLLESMADFFVKRDK